MEKIMDFCGTCEVALSMHSAVERVLESVVKPKQKVCIMIFVEDEPIYVPGKSDLKSFGEHVQSVEDDLHWNEHHEARMDRIGQNGNDGLVYEVLKNEST